MSSEGESRPSTSSGLSSRNATIQEYIEVAQQKRTIVTRQLAGKKKLKLGVDSDLNDQLMLPIGKMYHCERRGRGIVVRGAAQNIIFRKNTTYQRMLERCKEIYTEEEQENADFYVADSRGTPIWSSDKIKIDVANGSEEFEWTLHRHIQLSNVKYPSKAKYYCVRREVNKENDEGLQRNDDGMQSDDESLQRSDENVRDRSATLANMHPKKLQANHFEALFTLSKKSHYREAFLILSHLSQKRAIEEICRNDPMDNNELSDSVVILPQNPCHMSDNVYFTGIEMFDDSGDIKLDEKCDSLTGQIVYKMPQKDSDFGIWTGGLTYAKEHVALLAAVAVGGFHSVSVYSWSKDGIVCDDKYPILYATARGTYKSTIVTTLLRGDRITNKLSFTVEGSPDEWLVIVPSHVGYKSISASQLPLPPPTSAHQSPSPFPSRQLSPAQSPYPTSNHPSITTPHQQSPAPQLPSLTANEAAISATQQPSPATQLPSPTANKATISDSQQPSPATQLPSPTANEATISDPQQPSPATHHWLPTANEPSSSAVHLPSPTFNPPSITAPHQPSPSTISTTELPYASPCGSSSLTINGDEQTLGEAHVDTVTSMGSRLAKEYTDLCLEDPFKLHLMDVVGEGGFGTVYRASWRGCVVAAKVIPIQTRLRSEEVENLKRVQHPNLSSLLGIVAVGSSRIALVTPLVRGNNLHNILFDEQTRKLSFHEKILVCCQLCQAVVFLHTNVPPMAHLDIKPANILVDTLSLHVTLSDFGLSKVMTDTAHVGTRTMLAGSPGFQPPEQLMAIGIHCDVYALGAVMLVAFTEKPLWPSMSPFQIMFKVTVQNEKPDTSSLSPARLQTLCSDCFNSMESRPSVVAILKGLIGIMKDKN